MRRSGERWDLQIDGLVSCEVESQKLRQIMIIPTYVRWIRLGWSSHKIDFVSSTFFCPMLRFWREELDGDPVRIGGVEDGSTAVGEGYVGGEDGASLGRVFARFES